VSCLMSSLENGSVPLRTSRDLRHSGLLWRWLAQSA
jgi:hypothetical protein